MSHIPYYGEDTAPTYKTVGSLMVRDDAMSEALTELLCDASHRRDRELAMLESQRRRLDDAEATVNALVERIKAMGHYL
ncbi:MAG: hypothetical protein GY813_07240 [Halieaceae bacterium]|nr:hypothetical protein [Halieaceae bacterium]